MVRDLRKISLIRLVLSLALTLALVMTAFSHRAAVPVDGSRNLAAYVLPDGSLPSLCVSDDERSGGTKQGHGHPCEFCRIAGSAGLAPAPDIVVLQRFATRQEPPFQKGLICPLPALFPAAPYRGPPALSV